MQTKDEDNRDRTKEGYSSYGRKLLKQEFDSKINASEECKDWNVVSDHLVLSIAVVLEG